MSKYAKMSIEDFDLHYQKVLEGMTPGSIAAIPGVQEILIEELNNEILESWEQEQEEGKL